MQDCQSNALTLCSRQCLRVQPVGKFVLQAQWTQYGKVPAMKRANKIRTNTNEATIHFYTTKQNVSVMILDMKDFYCS